MKYLVIIISFLFALTCSAQTKRLIYEDGYSAGTVEESALKVSINNMLNIPTSNQILYSNGTNIVGSAGFTYDGNKLKMTGKPLHQEYATTTNLYKDVATFYNNTASNTGAIVFELPAVASNNQMLGATIRGYSYTTATGGGAFTLFLGGYAANSAWLYSYAELTGYAPFSTVTLGYNSSTSRYVIILGTTTTTWAYPKLIMTELLSGFGTSNQLATGWTTSLVTDLSPYSAQSTVSVTKNVKTTDEKSVALSIHRDLVTYKSPTASVTGAMIIETPITLASNQMNKFSLSGYNYDAGKSTWKVELGAFFFNNGHTPNYCEVQGDNPFGGKVRIAYNTVTSRYSLILGDTNTVWKYTSIFLDKAQITHAVALNMGAGWSVAPQTSLVNYSNITTPSTYIFSYLEKNQTFSGNQTFTGNVIVPNSTTSTHALNVATGDGRYLPTAAVNGTTGTYAKFTALNVVGNASLVDDANGVYYQSSAIERFRLHTDGRVNIGGITNRYSKLNVLGGINADSLKINNYVSLNGPTYLNYAPNFTPYQDGTDRIYVMKGDGELRSKELRDLLNDISANDTFALTGSAGGVFNLSSAATTVVDLGVYTNTMGTGNVLEFRLASGNPFYDNQQITVMSSGQFICGQGSKIRLADNSGTTLVQACNDQLQILTEPYEFTENPLRNFSITFQYSKKRNVWRIVNFKSFTDL